MQPSSEYAEYACGGCGHHFVSVMPEWEEKLPRCPMCQGAARIFEVLSHLLREVNRKAL